MMKIICVGKLSQPHLKTGIEHYQKQLPFKLTWIDIKDEPDARGLDKEGERIISKLKSDDLIIALAIEGVSLDSEGFARLLDDAFSYHQGDLVWIIGGSHGLSEAVKKRASKLISFSNLTFPHQLMRLILIEQIYRGVSIMRQHPYHK